MALAGNDFYVANSDAVMRFPYTEGETRITQRGIKVLDLPVGPINHHWTKNLLASRDGLKLYVTVGSNSNVAENGMDEEVGRAAIWEVDPKRGRAGKPVGEPIDVLTGFVSADGNAFGRPVGVALDKKAALLADDVGNIV